MRQSLYSCCLVPCSPSVPVSLREAAEVQDVRIPALSEFPMIKVVHPAYHCLPKGGHGSFCELGKRRLSCDLVLATRRTMGQSDIGVVEAAGSFSHIQQGM